MAQTKERKNSLTNEKFRNLVQKQHKMPVGIRRKNEFPNEPIAFRNDRPKNANATIKKKNDNLITDFECEFRIDTFFAIKFKSANN